MSRQPKHIRRVLLFFFCALLLSPSLAAETRLLFPVWPLEPTTFTGVVFVNTTGQNANLTLTAYDDGGNLVAGPGFNNPTQVQVPSGQQVGRLARALFCTGGDCSGVAPETVVWFEARTPVDDVTGFFFTLNNTVTAFDGADLPEPAISLLFPEVRIDGGFSTELNIVNPNPAPTSVTFRLLGGAVEQSVVGDIAGMGVSRVDVGTLFNQPAIAGAEGEALYIIADANLPIAGFEIVRAGGGDFLATSAKSAREELNTLFFPQLVVRGGSATELVVNNLDTQAVILTITAFQPGGTPYGAQDLITNPVQIALDPGEVLREDMETFFGFLPGDQLLQGWIKVESTSESINGSLTYEFPAVGSRATVASQALGRKQAIFSHIATTLGFFTGVATLNASSLVANVRVVAIARDGTVLGTYSTVLQPGERSSRVLSVIIPEAANRDGGTIWVTSTVPVFATALFGRFTTPTVGVLANIPPQSVPVSYQPDQGIERLTLNPDLAVLQTGQDQQFAVMGASETPTWKVNDISGGNPSVGTISNTGSYQAPGLLPMGLPISVTADAGNQVAGASVDVLGRQALIGNLGIVQSIAYLSGLQSLYTAELSALGSSSAGRARPAGGLDSTIFDVTDTPVSVVNFPGEEISNMVAFLGSDQREYLLLAARTSGRILRLDPQTGEAIEVATGLVSPAAIVLDAGTSDLVVAEEGAIRRILAAELNAGLSGTQSTGFLAPSGIDLAGLSPLGIALDRCTGRIYFSSVENGIGAISIIDPGTGTNTLLSGIDAQGTNTLLSGINPPGQLLGFYRAGVSCPDSFQLLAVQPDRIGLVLPQEARILNWIDAPGVRDLDFLPRDNRLANSEGVLSGETLGSMTTSGNTLNGQISFTGTPDLYTGTTINPPPVQTPDPPGGTPAVLITPFATCLEPGQQILFSAQVSGLPNTAVSWQTNLGSITQSGLFTAPSAGLVTVTATSLEFPDIRGEARVQVGGCECWWTVSVDSLASGAPGDVAQVFFEESSLLSVQLLLGSTSVTIVPEPQIPAGLTGSFPAAVLGSAGVAEMETYVNTDENSSTLLLTQNDTQSNVIAGSFEGPVDIFGFVGQDFQRRPGNVSIQFNVAGQQVIPAPGLVTWFCTIQ